MTNNKALAVHNSFEVSAAVPAGLQQAELVPPRPGLIVGLPRQLASQWIARLALAGGVHVLDGGNTFDAYGVARFIRAQSYELEAAMSRITVRRAFTCYQMAALLADLVETFRGPEQVRAETRKVAEQVRGVVVLDLLATFADENVPARERRRLFEQSLANLKSLARQHPTLVSSAARAGLPKAGDAPPVGYLMQLAEAADQVWHFEPSPKQALAKQTPPTRSMLKASAEQGRLF